MTNHDDITIFEALRADHDHQRAIAAELLETEGESGDRAELFDRLCAALTAHAAAEERYFYVPLMQSDTTQESARHSVAEHKELDDFVEKLSGYDMTAPQWIITAREFIDRLAHHLEEEEVEVFPVAGRVLTDDEKTELATAYVDDMARHADDLDVDGTLAPANA